MGWDLDFDEGEIYDKLLGSKHKKPVKEKMKKMKKKGI